MKKIVLGSLFPFINVIYSKFGKWGHIRIASNKIESFYSQFDFTKQLLWKPQFRNSKSLRTCNFDSGTRTSPSLLMNAAAVVLAAAVLSRALSQRFRILQYSEVAWNSSVIRETPHSVSKKFKKELLLISEIVNRINEFFSISHLISHGAAF